MLPFSEQGGDPSCDTDDDEFGGYDMTMITMVTIDTLLSPLKMF
jgi:hypothetical protein